MRQLVKSSSAFTSLVLTFLFVGHLGWSACAGNQMRVDLKMTVGGRDLGVMSFLEFEDRFYLQYGDWLSAIPVKVLKANQTGITFLHPDGGVVQWYVGKSKALVGGNELPVPTSPRIVDNRLHLPISGLASLIGAEFQYDRDGERLNIYGCLKEVRLVPHPEQGGWKLTLASNLSVGYKVKRLAPHEDVCQRLYVDMSGTRLAISPGQLIEKNASVAGLRAGQFANDPPISRVVLDLHEDLPVEDRTAPGSQQVVLFIADPALVVSGDDEDRWVDSVAVIETDGHKARVDIGVTDAFDYALTVLQDPFRVVIDFEKAQINLDEHRQLLVQNELIREVRVAEHDDEEDIVYTRVVLEMMHPMPYRVIDDPAESRVVVDIGSSVNSLVNRYIIIDPGHGGKKPGASSQCSPLETRLIEKDVALDIASHLEAMLRAAGGKPQMTRTSDVHVSLSQRVKAANAGKADAFVSVHLNAMAKPGENSGTETYYHTQQSRGMAESIHTRLIALLQRKDNGVRSAPFYVIRRTRIPAVLVEPAYLNDPAEEKLLRDKKFRKRIAEAVYYGLQDFFDQESGT